MKVDGVPAQEADWLAWSDPRVFLGFTDAPTDPTSRRKRRLLQAAFCRARDRLTTQADLLAAVDTLERHADGQAGRKEVREQLTHLESNWERLQRRGWKKTLIFVRNGLRKAVFFDYANSQREKQTHCHLIRDIFGNLFFNAVAAPEWLAWNFGTVPTLAQSIYDDRAFDRLPILADALEDAGCTNAAILNHCRGPGPHVRGCWVVDLLLGKE